MIQVPLGTGGMLRHGSITEHCCSVHTACKKGQVMLPDDQAEGAACMACECQQVHASAHHGQASARSALRSAVAVRCSTSGRLSRVLVTQASEGLTRAGRSPLRWWEEPGTLLQARDQQLDQAVAAGSPPWVSLAEHGPHVKEA